MKAFWLALFAAAGLSALEQPDGGVLFDGRADSGRAVREEASLAPAPKVARAATADAGNVVLVMFDGVRWQEFLSNKPDSSLSRGDAAPVLPLFWSRLASQGVVYGRDKKGSLVAVDNPCFCSLPAYQNIMAGVRTPCRDNDCGRIKAETCPERLVRELGLGPEQAATFASWDKMALAVESSPGRTAVTAGTGDDAKTFELALEHLKAKRPRFLFISLVETDDLAHAGDYPGYLAALRRYDAWLVRLVSELDAMGDYGKRTTLLVTTDHGRSVWRDWKSHKGRPWAGDVWLYARGPRTPAVGLITRGTRRTHSDIRPTLEVLLGLQPLAGTPLPEVLGQ